ncbi:Aste57867_9414 [Aphanomyces stellatus]|uniref:Aste57867_9414 protein n=1 Tax=Aphanomyces stellatus TaxID=120398 RepID=A0A485KN70_9STRA|nr:hypothetical protein As57867_009378 [Aphanomyces stellatus]VFT86294.1 Aste57867_9414 [Aphanomyces stellatus]
MEETFKKLDIESRLKKIEGEVDAFLKSVDTLKKTTTLSQRNHERKKLYKVSEFIRLDIEEELLKLHEETPGTPEKPAPSDELSKCKDPLVVDFAARVNAIRKQLTLEILPSDKSILEKVYMVVRLLTFAIIMFGGFMIVFVLIPLRWSHLIFRKLGVKNNYLPMDWIQSTFGLWLCLASGIQIYTNGRENLGDKLTDSTIAMFTHGSNLDGLMIQGTSPTTLKFIGKKALFMIPIVGWSFRWAFGNIPIDRSNIEASKRSLKALASAVIDYGRSVAISPEGTRSKCGQLEDFKKGPFYLQTDVKKSITPCLVHGAYELWPPGRLFTLSGKAYVDYLPQFHVDPKKSRNANRLALRRVYLEGLAKTVRDDLSTPPDTLHVLYHVACIAFFWVFILGGVSLICHLVASFSGLFGLTSVGMWQMIATTMLGLETFMHFTC